VTQELPPFPLPRLTNRPWREESLARAAELQALSVWLSHRPRPENDDSLEADLGLDAAIREHLHEAVKAAGDRRILYRNSARLARAASHLDAAEAHLLRRTPLPQLLGQLPSLHAHVRRHLPADDPRRIQVERLAMGDIDKFSDDSARESLIGAVRAASSAAQRESRRVLSFCRILWGATVLLAIVAVLVGLLGWFKSELVAICFTPQEEGMLVCPTGHTPLGADVDDIDPTVKETVTKWDVPLIEMVGAVAAAVTGSLTLRRMRGTSMPFSVPVSLTMLKLPTGALTAFVGLLLMRGGFVPGLTALDSTPQILAWAVIFGASQQVFTGLVDKQAHNVLDSVGNKTYMPSGGS
jgi:hypothetical protein